MRGTEEMEAEVEFDEGEEPSFSDPEDFEDDISDQGRSLFGQETIHGRPRHHTRALPDPITSLKTVYVCSEL